MSREMFPRRPASSAARGAAASCLVSFIRASALPRADVGIGRRTCRAGQRDEVRA